ncbi:hypothetical protein BKA66DRAFT_611320 [Pyrenochaeta sp. MPI-SDFR-AT-0127]|nr:hypothetical protein BKA66DRAFT_611320 [Pyrenochaeta sp. MPI-SDFR-AT-0127]
MVAPQLDPARLGGIKVDDHRFLLTTPVPRLRFGGARMEYRTSAPVDTGCFVIAGIVSEIPTLSVAIPEFVVSRYQAKYPKDLCDLGRPLLATASTSFFNSGNVCTIQVLWPSPSEFNMTPYLDPTSGTITVTDSVGKALFDLGQLRGRSITVLIKTTRGVRIVNYGLPPDPVYDANHVATNVSHS